MNAQVNTKQMSSGTTLVRSSVTIRPERLVVMRKEDAGVNAPERPYNWFQRAMLSLIGTLTARQLI
jgi:hypothetical protein